MKLLSEFIKELQELKEKHGDLPVVSCASDCFSEYIPDDDATCRFVEHGAFDTTKKIKCDCILII